MALILACICSICTIISFIEAIKDYQALNKAHIRDKALCALAYGSCEREVVRVLTHLIIIHRLWTVSSWNLVFISMLLAFNSIRDLMLRHRTNKVLSRKGTTHANP